MLLIQSPQSNVSGFLRFRRNMIFPTIWCLSLIAMSNHAVTTSLVFELSFGS